MSNVPEPSQTSEKGLVGMKGDDVRGETNIFLSDVGLVVPQQNLEDKLETGENFLREGSLLHFLRA